MAKLSNIAITHISLVKAGANKKEIIYKSSDKTPDYEKEIVIKASDEEGVVYGIVYAPDEVDTDGDYTDVDEIKKAAYAFMKSKNTGNVDKDHSFEDEDAFIAQSWILKENDPLFPDEPAGSWAVAIQLEDEELIKAVKDGDIAGISMAGTANKEDDDPEVTKADDKNVALTDLVDALKKVMGYVSFSVHGGYDKQIDKSKDEEQELKQEDIVAAVKTATEPLVKQVEDLQTKVTTLEKSNDETKEALKKSKQDDGVPPSEVEKEDGIGGIL